MIPPYLVWPQTHRSEAIDAIGLRLGSSLRTEAVSTTLVDLPKLVRNCAPALLHLPQGGFVAVLRNSRQRTQLLGPNQDVETVRHRDLVDALGDLPWRTASEPLSELRVAIDAGSRSVRRASRRDVSPVDIPLSAALANDRDLVRALADHVSLEVGELLVRPSSMRRLSRQWISKLLSLLALHAIEQGLWITSWAILGHAILSHRIESGWLLAWSLLLLTQLPFRSAVSWLQSSLALRFTAEVKTRVLRGSMALDPDQLRGHGVGHFMGRSLEADALSRLTLDGGFSALLAVVEFAFALLICHQGAGGNVQILVLVTLQAVGGLLAALEWRQRSRWTSQRIALAEDMVDAMIGHRTLLAQGNQPGQERQDVSIANYLSAGRSMDATRRRLDLLPRVWMILSVMTLAPSWLSASVDPTAMAIGVGATLLGYRALERGTRGLSQLAAAFISWQQVSSLVSASVPSSSTEFGEANLASATTSSGAEPRKPTLQLSDIDVYRKQSRRPILDRCSLSVFPGDRILLRGASGSGKSTLAAIAASLRDQDAGLRLVHGLDLPAHGTRQWRRTIALAPQFHENHLFSDTLAFNLLMAGRWPPSSQDLEEAEELCHALGLGDLLGRMPAGLFQPIGDTGWRLSHGESGRVFLARALLQSPELLILDETLGALDPESHRRALEVVDQRVSSVVVVDQSG
ncbi:MAG: ABC transporter ATP-binding protein/permease [Thermoanaerobaculia bacterium]|nr:ABC transporter ATP-binding protein/permease [Thermoanaerobaculia bacterium]